MILLDTNVVSELRKVGDGKADPRVVAWLSGLDASSFYLSAMTVMELELGILLLARRDARQAGMLQAWLDRNVLPAFSGRIISMDEAVARRCARLHVPDPRSERDAFIAATAIVHGMTLATRNIADFKGCGAVLVNPWLERPDEA